MLERLGLKMLAPLGLLVSCAAVIAAQPQGSVVLDVDFQQGPGGLPDGVKVHGGMWLGGDRYNDAASMLGMRFLRMKLIDNDVPKTAK
jgi:hypothetical protein